MSLHSTYHQLWRLTIIWLINFSYINYIAWYNFKNQNVVIISLFYINNKFVSTSCKIYYVYYLGIRRIINLFVSNMSILSCGGETICHSASDLKKNACYRLEKLNTLIPSVLDISLSVDGNNCVIVPENGHVQVLNFDIVKKKFKLQQILTKIPKPTCCAFMKLTGDQIFVGTKNGEVHVWNNVEGEEQIVFTDSNSPVFVIDFFMHDSHFAVGNKKGLINVFDESFVLQKTFTLPDPESLTNIRCHPLRRGYLGATGNNGDAMVWDIKYINPKYCQFYAKLAHVASCTDLAFSKINQRILATVGYDKIISCYDMATNEAVLTILAEESLTSIDTHLDGKTIATGDVQGGITIFDLRNYRRPLHSLKKVHLQPVKKVLFWASQNPIDRIVVPDHMKEEMFKDGNEYRAIWHVLGMVDQDMNPITVYDTNGIPTEEYPAKKKKVLNSLKLNMQCTLPRTVKEMQAKLHSNVSDDHYTDGLYDKVDCTNITRRLAMELKNNNDCLPIAGKLKLLKENKQSVNSKTTSTNIKNGKILSTKSKVRIHYEIIVALSSGLLKEDRLENNRHLSALSHEEKKENGEKIISCLLKEKESDLTVSASLSTMSSTTYFSVNNFSNDISVLSEPEYRPSTGFEMDAEHYHRLDNTYDAGITNSLVHTQSIEDSRSITTTFQRFASWITYYLFGNRRLS
ncbi:uncharacterized protein Grip71 [Periplaneta americana]|uniref:uncharacterized protein Grip71 n=1 Tax=Periplaneta americana TaxID=6978 RepID=UPI0037E8399D